MTNGNAAYKERRYKKTEQCTEDRLSCPDSVTLLPTTCWHVPFMSVYLCAIGVCSSYLTSLSIHIRVDGIRVKGQSWVEQVRYQTTYGYILREWIGSNSQPCTKIVIGWYKSLAVAHSYWQRFVIMNRWCVRSSREGEREFMSFSWGYSELSIRGIVCSVL